MVQEHHVEVVVPGEIEPVLPIVRMLDNRAVATQQSGQATSCRGVGIYYENTHRLLLAVLTWPKLQP